MTRLITIIVTENNPRVCGATGSLDIGLGVLFEHVCPKKGKILKSNAGKETQKLPRYLLFDKPGNMQGFFRARLNGIDTFGQVRYRDGLDAGKFADQLTLNIENPHIERFRLAGQLHVKEV